MRLRGTSLADGLAEFPNAFPKLYRSTVAAGEHAGHLDLVLNRFADYTESRAAGAPENSVGCDHPIILDGGSGAIVVFLLSYVVPDIIKVFINNGQPLPALTQWILNLSHFLADYGIYLFSLIIMGFMLFGYGMRKMGFRLMIQAAAGFAICEKIFSEQTRRDLPLLSVF